MNLLSLKLLAETVISRRKAMGLIGLPNAVKSPATPPARSAAAIGSSGGGGRSGARIPLKPAFSRSTIFQKLPSALAMPPHSCYTQGTKP